MIGKIEIRLKFNMYLWQHRISGFWALIDHEAWRRANFQDEDSDRKRVIDILNLSRAVIKHFKGVKTLCFIPLKWMFPADLSSDISSCVSQVHTHLYPLLELETDVVEQTLKQFLKMEKLEEIWISNGLMSRLKHILKCMRKADPRAGTLIRQVVVTKQAVKPKSQSTKEKSRSKNSSHMIQAPNLSTSMAPRYISGIKAPRDYFLNVVDERIFSLQVRHKIS